VLFQRGVAYLELGRHNDALELLIAARAMLPANYRRDHGRYAANIATAAALDGQLDRAASAAREALSDRGGDRQCPHDHRTTPRAASPRQVAPRTSRHRLRRSPAHRHQ
jgi:tetratricopeptide (TPR) repeat protein